MLKNYGLVICVGCCYPAPYLPPFLPARSSVPVPAPGALEALHTSRSRWMVNGPTGGCLEQRLGLGKEQEGGAGEQSPARRHIVVIKIWQFSTFLTSLHNKTCTRTRKKQRKSRGITAPNRTASHVTWGRYEPGREGIGDRAGVGYESGLSRSQCQRAGPVNRLCKYLPNLLKFISDQALSLSISFSLSLSRPQTFF